jgi:hypothetical protein
MPLFFLRKMYMFYEYASKEMFALKGFFAPWLPWQQLPF